MKKLIALSLIACSLSLAKAQLAVEGFAPEVVQARTPFEIAAQVSDATYGTRPVRVLVLIRRDGQAYRAYRFVTDRYGYGAVAIEGLPSRGRQETYTFQFIVTQQINDTATVTAIQPGLLR